MSYPANTTYVFQPEKPATKMVITAYWPDGSLKCRTEHANCGGWESPELAQRELLRRWSDPRYQTRKFGNGIETLLGYCGIKQTITFEA